MEVYSKAMRLLANLLKANQELEGRQDPDELALQEAMREAYKKLTGEEPPDGP